MTTKKFKENVSYRIASIIKMAILNHANHLPLNLQMENLLLGTTINFLIGIVKMFYLS